MDLTRIAVLFVGGDVKSIALAGLAPSPFPLAVPFAAGPDGFGPVIAGDAVCARGGGGGGVGLGSSAPA